MHKFITITLLAVGMATITAGLTPTFVHADTPAINWVGSDTGKPIRQVTQMDHFITYQNQATNKNKTAFEAAIKAWNQLNVVTFVPSDHQPSIVLTSRKADFKTLATKQLRGQCQYQITDRNMMANTIVSLNPRLKISNAQRILNAEQQIGHALGLADDTKLVDHVMDPNATAKTVVALGSLEQQALMQQYGN